MKNISVDITKAAQFLKPGAVEAYESQVKAAQEALENGTCPGNDFLGWLHLPTSITPEFLSEIQDTANTLRDKCEVIVVAGIGGSYLGARAVIEALGNSFAWLTAEKKNPIILFAGNNIGEDYLFELTEYLKGKKFGVINISKSGTTTETALTFRLLKKQCEAQRGKAEAKDVIVAVTDAKKGAARTCADKEGYKSFIIPDNIGGRFSVLTPVGLLPIACAGFDVKQLVSGAQEMERVCGKEVPFNQNPAALYAAAFIARQERRLRLLLTSNQSSISLQNGGNNYLVRAKVKTIKVSSQQHVTSQPTCTLWVNGFKRANVLFLKQSSVLRNQKTNCFSHTTKRT